jgi:hypothetical protein
MCLDFCVCDEYGDDVYARLARDRHKPKIRKDLPESKRKHAIGSRVLRTAERCSHPDCQFPHGPACEYRTHTGARGGTVVRAYREYDPFMAYLSENRRGGYYGEMYEVHFDDGTKGSYFHYGFTPIPQTAPAN